MAATRVSSVRLAMAVRAALCCAAVALAGAAWPPIAAQAPAPDAARIDVGRLVEDLETLSAPDMEGRLTGSPGSKRAQAYILGRFKELKLQPVGGAYEHPFSFTRTRGGTQAFPDAVNLIATLPGTTRRDRYLLVTAH